MFVIREFLVTAASHDDTLGRIGHQYVLTPGLFKKVDLWKLARSASTDPWPWPALRNCRFYCGIADLTPTGLPARNGAWLPGLQVGDLECTDARW